MWMCQIIIRIVNGPLFARHPAWFWGAQKTHPSSECSWMLASTHVLLCLKITNFSLFTYLSNGHIVLWSDFSPPLQPIKAIAQLYLDLHDFMQLYITKCPR
jgi:hypothetical protein